MISIITVNYNNLGGLKNTASSLSKIDKCLFEWIVIDGGSTDGSIDFIKTNLLISNFIAEADSGIYDAMNKGVILANQDYVWFLNSGDTVCTDFSPLHIKSAIRESPDAIFCSVYYDYGYYRYLRHPRDLGYATYGMPANHQGILYRSSLLRKMPYPMKFGVSEDYWLSAKLLAINAKCVLHDYPIAEFSVGGVSTVKFLHVCKSMAKIQNDVLGLGSIRIGIYFARRICTMSINYALYKVSKFLRRINLARKSS